MLTDCRNCQATVNAEVQGWYESFDHELSVPERFSLGKCPVCSAPFLLAQADFGNGWDEPSRLYPPRDSLIGASVPKAIRNAFTEATRCFFGKAFTACAVMCRKTLEGVCADHGVNKGSLQKRLEALRDQGVIEGRLFTWADELRLVGNDAAHDVNVEVDASDARDTVDFTRAVLEYVYTFRDRFENFRKRRSKEKQGEVQPASDAKETPLL